MTICRYLLIASVVVALGTGSGAAADRFVSVDGDDLGFTNDCLSMASPCRSIGWAAVVAEAGDVVKASSGTYDSNVLLLGQSHSLTISGSWALDFGSRDPSTHGSVLRGKIQAEAGLGDVLSLTLDGLTIMRGDPWGIGLGASQDGVVNLTVQNCAIRRNRTAGLEAVALGAAIVNIDIVDSLVSGNRASEGAVDIEGYGTSTSSLTMSGSTVEKTRGVGVFLDARESSSVSATLTDSVIYRNKRGIEVSGVNATLTDTSVIRNRRGGVYSHGASVITLTNGVVARNRGLDYAAGIHQFGPGSLDLANTTLRGNRAICSVAGCAGGIAANAGSVDLLNVIAWANSTATGDAGDLAITGATVTADHSDLGDVSGTYTDLGGNISADPLFAGRDDDHLMAGSPAIDTGTCTGAPAADFEGDLRPTGGGCDMGADEFAP